MGRPGYRPISLPDDLYEDFDRLNPPSELRPTDGREAAGVVWKIRAALKEAVRSWHEKYPGLEVFGVLDEDDREGWR